MREERFFRGCDEDAYLDGTGSSECGPMFLFGGVMGNNYVEKPKKVGCVDCGGVIVNESRKMCQWHNDHHDLRMKVHRGEITEAEYQILFLAHVQNRP